MSALNLSSYLTALSNMSDYDQLFIRAKYLARVQKHLLSNIPFLFRNRCTVGEHTADGLLTIYVDNGAVATQLRNFAPSIQQKMNQAGIRVEAIKFRIQPLMHSRKSEESREVTHLLSQTATDHLRKLSDSLPAGSPLQSALKVLLANNNSRDP